MVELLPKHSLDCYGLEAHWTRCEEYCNCKMKEIRKEIKDLK